jgi:hypothetical protein
MNDLFHKITKITNDESVSARIFLALNEYIHSKERMDDEFFKSGKMYQYYVSRDDLEFGNYVFSNYFGENFTKATTQIESK